MVLVSSLLVVCGRANYTNLSRYSEISERTYRRHFNAGMGLEPINQQVIEASTAADSVQILVVDCTFNEKSGRATPDLDWFYNGKTQQVERGLEWSVVAVVDLQQHTAYALSAQQTEAAIAARVKAAEAQSQVCGNTKVIEFASSRIPIIVPVTESQDISYRGFWHNRQIVKRRSP